MADTEHFSDDTARQVIRARFDAEITATQATGSRLDRKSLASSYMALGVPTPTIYRWIDKAMRGEGFSPKPIPAKRRAQMARGMEKLRTLDPADNIDLVAPLDPLETDVVTPEMQDALAESETAVANLASDTGSGNIPVLDHVQACLTISDRLIKHATLEDGTIRNTKLLLAASEHKRRAADTAARLTQVMLELRGAERFNKEIIAVIRRISARVPSIGADLVRELDTLAARWTGGQ